jgi:hypothetical protein
MIALKAFRYVTHAAGTATPFSAHRTTVRSDLSRAIWADAWYDDHAAAAGVVAAANAVPL